MPGISVVIICKNEEKNIAACLGSVKWCDEIIVIDAFSTDKTQDIVKKFTDKLFQKEWAGFSEQRKFGLEKCTKDWIFALDADERCTHELKEEILKLIKDPAIKENGFFIPRKSFFLDTWIKHSGWYPGYQMRLFKRSKVKLDNRIIHEKYEVESPTGKLKSDMLHYTVTSLEEFMSKINKYSTLQAKEKASKRDVGYFGMFFRPRLSFFKQYILRLGFLDGTPGLMVAYYDMITQILVNSKIREIKKK
ncbi:glycosyltransferase family 2 protein [soil metagenome]